jgi:hypothetical protein
LKEEAEQATQFLYGGSKRTTAPCAGLWIGAKWFEGPADKLSTSTFGEFILAEAAFSSWAKSGSDQQLDRLCAILYRPKKPFWQLLSAEFDGDRRVKLNSNMLADRAKAFSKAPQGFKLAVAAYFAGSLEAMASSFPRLFQKASKDAKPSKAIWMKAAARLANGLPNYDAILKTRLSLALFQLSELAEEAERIREATEKYSKK